jgi:hypothetical protein
MTAADKNSKAQQRPGSGSCQRHFFRDRPNAKPMPALMPTCHNFDAYDLNIYEIRLYGIRRTSCSIGTPELGVYFSCNRRLVSAHRREKLAKTGHFRRGKDESNSCISWTYSDAVTLDYSP